MKSWIQHGTTHTPVEVFTGSNESKSNNGKEIIHNKYLIVEMQVVGCSRMYLGLFKDTGQVTPGRKNTTKLFIANFRIGPHGIPREEAIARLKAKAE
jgi:hypothetical protein